MEIKQKVKCGKGPWLIQEQYGLPHRLLTKDSRNTLFNVMRRLCKIFQLEKHFQGWKDVGYIFENSNTSLDS